jgi:undecaprenyl-diphosphatase
MDSLQIVILAIVQGLTEFLPISSSAHLILMPHLFGWPDQGLVFDVAVHFGSLIAVLFYFRVEVWRMLRSWTRSVSGGEADRDSLLAWWVIIGTLPAVAFGFFGQHWIETQLREPWVIALASIGFGLLLWFADSRGVRRRDEYQLRLSDVLMIGFAQVLALIPGTSRSGITITFGLLLGLTRQAAARFAFLLSIPVIVASGALETHRMFSEVSPIGWLDLSVGTLLSAISAGLCIHFFLRLVDRIGMLPFVVYRVLLGVVILIMLT